jgi:GMP synthase PP-ATPase subunit
MPTTIQTEHHIELTSAEVASIWTSYLSDTLAICMIGTFLRHVEDKQIRSVLEFAYQLSQAHVQKLKAFFTEDKLPLPDGFSPETDTHKAPRLFTDDFYQFYIQNIGKVGMLQYTVALSNSARLDMCEYANILPNA